MLARDDVSIHHVGILRESKNDDGFIVRLKNALDEPSSPVTDWLKEYSVTVPVPESLYQLLVRYMKQDQWPRRHGTAGYVDNESEWQYLNAGAFVVMGLLVQAIERNLHEKQAAGTWQPSQPVGVVVSDHFDGAALYWVNALIKRQGFKVTLHQLEHIPPINYADASSLPDKAVVQPQRMWMPRLERMLRRLADVISVLSPHYANDVVRDLEQLTERHSEFRLTAATMPIALSNHKVVPQLEQQPARKVMINNHAITVGHNPAGIDADEWREYPYNPHVQTMATEYQADYRAQGLWRTEIISFGRLDDCKFQVPFKWHFLRAMVCAWQNHGVKLWQHIGISEKSAYSASTFMPHIAGLNAANDDSIAMANALAALIDSGGLARDASFSMPLPKPKLLWRKPLPRRLLIWVKSIGCTRNWRLLL